MFKLLDLGLKFRGKGGEPVAGCSTGWDVGLVLRKPCRFWFKCPIDVATELGGNFRMASGVRPGKLSRKPKSAANNMVLVAGKNKHAW